MNQVQPVFLLWRPPRGRHGARRGRTAPVIGARTRRCTSPNTRVHTRRASMCRRVFGRGKGVSAPTSVVGARASRTHRRSRVVYGRHHPCTASRMAVHGDARRCTRSSSPCATGAGHDVPDPRPAARCLGRNWLSTWILWPVETCIGGPAGQVLAEVQRLGQLLGALTPLRRGPRGPCRGRIRGPGDLIGADVVLQGPCRGSTPPRRGSTPPCRAWGMSSMAIGDPLRAPDAARSAPSGVTSGAVERPRAAQEPEHGDGDGDRGGGRRVGPIGQLPHALHTGDHPPPGRWGDRKPPVRGCAPSRSAQRGLLGVSDRVQMTSVGGQRGRRRPVLQDPRPAGGLVCSHPHRERRVHVASGQPLLAGENPWGSSAWRVVPRGEPKTDVSSTKHTGTVTSRGAKLCPPPPGIDSTWLLAA